MTESESIFPPPYLPPPQPVVQADGGRRYDGVTYAEIPGFRPLLADVYLPPTQAPPPVVLWIHGGGWFAGDRRYTPATAPAELVFGSMLAAGMAVATVDYRFFFESRFPAQLHDVQAAIRYLRRFAGELGIDMTRLAVAGDSAGGLLAALVGLTADVPELAGSVGIAEGSLAVDAVLDWYGVSDLEACLDLPHPPPTPPGVKWPYPNPFVELLGGDESDRRARARVASPVSYIDADAPPFLLIHGTEDSVVPFAQSELLHKELVSVGASSRLISVDGAEHTFLRTSNVPALVEESVAFLAEHLQPVT